MRKYMQDGGSGLEVNQALLSLYQDKTLFETSNSELTIIKSTGTVEMLKPLIENHFLVIVFFMVFLSIILNQSLVQSVS